VAVRRDGVELDSFPFTIPALRSLEALEKAFLDAPERLLRHLLAE